MKLVSTSDTCPYRPEGNGPYGRRHTRILDQ